ncbi:hypothetical protein BCR44DRAFT_326987 [Catenaria anguillulae PL171]|uniref:Uncharacterized protein n=1 Tax=Catenaria anguillulae PL171 TaxID=765915 RepID=A0A1Y2H9D8_9FUNG|nr:hypothetical protein BCR44DRAFT_326987 [Catenaria anguillulae PL171]
MALVPCRGVALSGRTSKWLLGSAAVGGEAVDWAVDHGAPKLVLVPSVGMASGQVGESLWVRLRRVKMGKWHSIQS